MKNKQIYTATSMVRVFLLLLLQLSLFPRDFLFLHAADAAAAKISAATSSLPAVPLIALNRTQYPIVITCHVSSTTALFVQHAAAQYRFMRPDVDIEINQVSSSGNLSSSDILLNMMAIGDADFAFSTVVPTQAQRDAAPDLMHYPAAAFPFGAAYNLPMLKGTLILDMDTLARIFIGNITKWNDPAIIGLNPGARLPNANIEIVVLSQSTTYMKAATHAMAAVNSQFRSMIAESVLPQWPLGKYAKYTLVDDSDLIAAYVVSTPNTLGLSLLYIASRFSVSIASMRNDGGFVVPPTFYTFNSGFTDEAVHTSMGSDGHIQTSIMTFMTNAPGANSWPLLAQGMFTLAREYSRSSCKQRTELIKFLLFILDSSTVRDAIAPELQMAVSSDELDSSIGLRQALQSTVNCEGLRVNIGQGGSTTTTVGYSPLSFTNTNDRLLLVSQYAATDPTTQYDLVAMDELLQIQTMLRVHHTGEQEIDASWISPITFKHLYPGVIEETSSNNTVSYFPSALIGIMPTFNLHPNITAFMQAKKAFPLQIDTETLAQVFLGEVDSWISPAILNFNPKLADAYAANPLVSTRMTRVLFGVEQAGGDGSLLAVSNHFIVALNHTQTFRQSDLQWSLPADWTNLTQKLDQTGAQYVFARSETAMSGLIGLYHGSIGYTLADANITNPLTDFSIVRHAVTPAGIQDVIVQGTPAALKYCFDAAALATNDPLANIDIESVLDDMSLSASQCWPFPILSSMAIPTDVDSSALDQLAVDATAEYIQKVSNSLCFHRKKIVSFLQYISTNSQLNKAIMAIGREGLTESPKWASNLMSQLLNLKCLGKFLLYTPNITWKLSSSVYTFVMAASLMGLGFVGAIGLVVIRYYKRTLIVSSDYILQACDLAGASLLCFSSMMFIQIASSGLCIALSWTLSLGLTMLLAPQTMRLAKVYHRMIQTQKRKGLRTRSFTNFKLYMAIFALVLVDVFIIMAATLPQTAGGLLSPVKILHAKSLDTYEYVTCAPSSAALPYVAPLIGIKIVTLLAGSYFGFKVRYIASAFGESQKVSWSLWSALVSGIIIFPLIALTGGLYDDLYVLLACFFVLWVCIGSLGLLFGYKVFALTSEAWKEYQQNNKSVTSFRNASSHASTGTSRGTGTGTGTGTSHGSVASSGFSNHKQASYEFQDITKVHLNYYQLRKYINALERELEKAQIYRQKSMKAGKTTSAPKTSGAGAVYAVNEVKHDNRTAHVSISDNTGHSPATSTASNSPVTLMAQPAPTATQQQPVTPVRQIPSPAPDRRRMLPRAVYVPQAATSSGSTYNGNGKASSHGLVLNTTGDVRPVITSPPRGLGRVGPYSPTFRNAITVAATSAAQQQPSSSPSASPPFTAEVNEAMNQLLASSSLLSVSRPPSLPLRAPSRSPTHKHRPSMPITIIEQNESGSSDPNALRMLSDLTAHVRSNSVGSFMLSQFTPASMAPRPHPPRLSASFRSNSPAPNAANDETNAEVDPAPLHQ